MAGDHNSANTIIENVSITNTILRESELLSCDIFQSKNLFERYAIQ